MPNRTKTPRGIVATKPEQVKQSPSTMQAAAWSAETILDLGSLLQMMMDDDGWGWGRGGGLKFIWWWSVGVHFCLIAYHSHSCNICFTMTTMLIIIINLVTFYYTLLSSSYVCCCCFWYVLYIVLLWGLFYIDVGDVARFFRLKSSSISLVAISKVAVLV